MSLAALLQKGSLRAVETLTVATTATVEPKNPPSVAKVAIVNVASAENFKSDCTTTADVDRWCYPHSEAQNTSELERTESRLKRFHALGLPANTAGLLADKLIERDRTFDDRHLCCECRHLHGRLDHWRCGNHAQAGLGEPAIPAEWPLLFQRCFGFQKG